MPTRPYEIPGANAESKTTAGGNEWWVRISERRLGNPATA